MNYTPLQGFIAAPFTPMHRDGSLNPDAIEHQAEHLARTGITGAFICGTTGEGASLRIDERIQVATRWMEVTGGRGLKVIVHTGHTSLEEARTLAAHAQTIGAYATAALAPCFFKPANVRVLVECCAQIARAAPDLPFYYYHIPALTGVDLPVRDLLEQAAGSIRNLAGVKYTHNNLQDYAMCREVEDGRFDMPFGRDEMLLSALVLGARGAVGSTYNYSARIYLRLIEAFSAGNLDEARRLQSIANRFIAIMARHGGLRAAKQIMGMVGVDCGPTRLPLPPLTADEVRRLRDDLETADFFRAVAPQRS